MIEQNKLDWWHIMRMTHADISRDEFEELWSEFYYFNTIERTRLSKKFGDLVFGPKPHRGVWFGLLSKRHRRRVLIVDESTVHT